jgi:alpha-ketoglutarate-dependent taurine dioxygenase
MSADGHQELSTTLDIRPVAGRIGAEIAGVTLSADLPPETLAAIEAALHRHKVLFFHGQTHLDDASQEAFASRLGDPQPHPTVPVSQGSQYLLELDSAHGGRANSWHTDITFLPAYPKASILRAVQSTVSGGDTVWANTAEAYKRLPEGLRELADRTWAIHQRLRLCGGQAERQAGGRRPAPTGLRLHRLRDRTSCGAGAPLHR